MSLRLLLQVSDAHSFDSTIYIPMRPRTVHFRSPSRHSPDVFTDAFSQIAHHHDLLNHSSTWRFEARVCTLTSGGRPPSLMRHRNSWLSKRQAISFVSRRTQNTQFKVHQM